MNDKIIFFKDGNFPYISESHIINKITYLKDYKKILICKSLQNEQKNYLDKIKNIKKYEFQKFYQNKNPSFNKKIKNKIEKILKNIFNYKEFKANNITLNLYYYIEKLIFILTSFFNIKHRLNYYYKILKKEKVKIINGCYGWEIIPLSIIKNKINFKIVLDIRGKDLALIHKYKLIRKLSIKNADLLLTRSKSMRQELLKLGINKNKVKVNHSGCDLNIFKFDKENNNKKLDIITIGRLVEKKGHHTLIKACELLYKKNINFDLKIIGEGEKEDKIKKLIKTKNLEKNITLLGNIKNSEIPKHLKESNIFILASHKSKQNDIEGIPVALMEAMAKGLICISTKHSGIPELINNNETGFLIKEKNFKELFEILKKIKTLNKIKLQNIQKNARKKIEKEFDAKKQAEEFKKLIKEI